MIYRIILLAAVLLTAWHSMRAQESVQLSLAQAQEHALKNGFSIINARSDAEAARLQTQELIGIGLPQLNGSVQYQNFINLPTSIVPGDFVGQPGSEIRVQFGVPHQLTAGLSASQLLFDGSWLVGLQASRAYSALVSQQVRKTESDIRKEVAEAYHLALIARKNVELLEASRSVLSETLEQTRALLKEGFVEEQDVDQLSLSLNDWDNRITNAKAQIRLTSDLLKFTIGMPQATEVVLSDEAESLLLQSSDLLSAGFSPENAIEFQLAQKGLGMQQLNLRNQKAKMLPSLAAFYNLQSQALRREFNFTDTGKPWFPIQLWGVQLNVPILSGGSRMKSIERARVEVERMNATVNYTREAVSLEYNSALTSYRNALAVYETSKASFDLSEKILGRTTIKYREGVASSFDVSQSTSQALQSQGTFIQSMLDLMNAQVRLRKALNQL